MLIGVDGSAESLVAADWAAEEAERRHLGFQLIHAYVISAVGVPAYGMPPDISGAFRVEAEGILAKAADKIRASHPAWTSRRSWSTPTHGRRWCRLRRTRR